MEPEAHTLISLSLGKIAASKSQRGGLNLRKSLLLTHVLQQAKNVYILENYENIMSAKKKHVKALTTEVSVCKSPIEVLKKCRVIVPKMREFSDFASCTSRAIYQPQRSGDPEVTMDTIELPNKFDRCNEIGQDSISHFGDNQTAIDKENQLHNEPSGFNTSIDIDSCARCAKRKLELSPNSDNTAEDIGSPLKKLKDCDTTPSDCSQISSLVQRFSTGFSGLVNSCPSVLADGNSQIASCRFGLGNITRGH